ncbi:hypothetical protein J1614_004462 [Plenodomus biglobosus]|nr:hypothetical protein J1614_004462 [Plenodomus biglobosus]
MTSQSCLYNFRRVDDWEGNWDLTDFSFNSRFEPCFLISKNASTVKAQITTRSVARAFPSAIFQIFHDQVDSMATSNYEDAWHRHHSNRYLKADDEETG